MSMIFQFSFSGSLKKLFSTKYRAVFQNFTEMAKIGLKWHFHTESDMSRKVLENQPVIFNRDVQILRKPEKLALWNKAFIGVIFH